MDPSVFPVMALLLYLGAHGLRCVRLYILSLGERRGGARLVAAHCLTAWLNALIPFKLGEALRIATFGAAVRDPLSGMAIWLVERLSDALALTVLLAGLALLVPLGLTGRIVLAISGAFIVACAFGAWIALELVPFLRRDLLCRSRSNKGLALLKVIHRVEHAMAQARVLLVGRFSVTLLAAFLIWACELGAAALWSWHAAGEPGAALDLLSTDPEALSQRTPVFVALTAIGVVLTGSIIVRRRRAG